MILFKNGAEMAGWARQQRAAGRQTGFIPTMGALHPGHLSLIDSSKKALPVTVCSIFVNPTQFNDPKDFQKYPITIENDIYLLERAGVDALFLPEVEEIYPGGVQNLEKYALGRLETLWEGKFRPGHFQGVCQVVKRLLDFVQPDHLFMGQKDYQQCLVIRRLLDLTGSAVLMHICPIMREADGLAMSSRNQRLSAEERKKAPAIYEALSWLAAHWHQGALARDQETARGQGTALSQGIALDREAALDEARNILIRQGLRPDYIALADAGDLEPLKGTDERSAERNVVALAAAYLGEIRLIDNLLLKDH
jgi:pantoate--beta-alanine ligase